MLAEYFPDQIYLISTATLLLAVVVALYFSNFLKDDNDTERKMESNYDNECSGLNNCEENENNRNGNEDDDDDDDDDFMQTDAGILAKIKSARWKALEEQLTEDQIKEERKIEREQLAAIFELLKKQESDLNFKEIDENELNAQLNLYR